MSESGHLNTSVKDVDVMGDDFDSDFYLELSTVLGTMRGTFDIDIPPDLVRGIEGPFAQESHEILGYTWVNKLARPLYEKFFTEESGWDNFAGESPLGYLAVGGGGFGSTVIQSHSIDALFSMKFDSPFIGEMLSTKQEGMLSTKQINEYLSDISQFLWASRSRDLQAEIVEYPEFGRYRLFDKQGRSVEKQMQLIESEDRVKQLNRLIAEVGLLNVGLDSSPEHFLARDDEFQSWQWKNQSGSVMVLIPSLMPSRPFIHSAGCPTMVEEQLPENKVVCATDIHGLLEWARKNDLAVPGLCSKCFLM